MIAHGLDVWGDALSLQPHVILDRFYPFDPMCDIDCLVDVSLGIDETAQLNDPFEGLDVNLRYFQGRLIKN